MIRLNGYIPVEGGTIEISEGMLESMLEEMTMQIDAMTTFRDVLKQIKAGDVR